VPDISMCPGDGCPRKRACYRYRAVPDPRSQVYFDPPLAADGSCPEFVELRPGDRLIDEEQEIA
jgi:hypothetical protein